MYRKILVPLDGSELAEQILPHAEGLAKLGQGEVILFYVVPVIRGFEEAELSPEALREQIAARGGQASKYLQRIEEDLKQKGVTARSAVTDGDPATRIVDFAEEEGVDLIAMSTHGRSGLSRWVLGSVAEKVLRTATKPVLLTRVHTVKILAG